MSYRTSQHPDALYTPTATASSVHAPAPLSVNSTAAPSNASLTVLPTTSASQGMTSLPSSYSAAAHTSTTATTPPRRGTKRTAPPTTFTSTSLSPTPVAGPSTSAPRPRKRAATVLTRSSPPLAGPSRLPASPPAAAPTHAHFLAQPPAFQVTLPYDPALRGTASGSGTSGERTRAPYGSGDTDEGYTLEFKDMAEFSAWRDREEESRVVEFIKGDTHGSKAQPPRFKDHVKLVCARHCKSGRRKYVRKCPERTRKVPSRKLEGNGCPASISYKTYYDTPIVRAMYVSEHSHPTGEANRPFTRRGRKLAEQERREKQQSGFNRANPVLNGTASAHAASHPPTQDAITLTNALPLPAAGATGRAQSALVAQLSSSAGLVAHRANSAASTASAGGAETEVVPTTSERDSSALLRTEVPKLESPPMARLERPSVVLGPDPESENSGASQRQTPPVIGAYTSRTSYTPTFAHGPTSSHPVASTTIHSAPASSLSAAFAIAPSREHGSYQLIGSALPYTNASQLSPSAGSTNPGTAQSAQPVNLLAQEPVLSAGPGNIVSAPGVSRTDHTRYPPPPSSQIVQPHTQQSLDDSNDEYRRGLDGNVQEVQEILLPQQRRTFKQQEHTPLLTPTTPSPRYRPSMIPTHTPTSAMPPVAASYLPSPSYSQTQYSPAFEHTQARINTLGQGSASATQLYSPMSPDAPITSHVRTEHTPSADNTHTQYDYNNNSYYTTPVTPVAPVSAPPPSAEESFPSQETAKAADELPQPSSSTPANGVDDAVWDRAEYLFRELREYARTFTFSPVYVAELENVLYRLYMEASANGGVQTVQNNAPVDALTQGDFAYGGVGFTQVEQGQQNMPMSTSSYVPVPSGAVIPHSTFQ